MRHSFSTAGLVSSLAIAGLIAAACGGTGAPASPGSSVVVVVPSVAVPSVAIPSVSIPPVPSGLPTSLPSGLPSVAIPSFNADPELEARLPNDVAGVTLRKASFKGGDVPAEATELRALLTTLGRSIEDVGLANASSPQDAPKQVSITAVRIAGADAARFKEEFVKTAVAEDEFGADVAETTIGGKSVTTVTEKPDPNEPSPDPEDVDIEYAYFTGDTAFIVETDDPAVREEAFSKLP